MTHNRAVITGIGLVSSLGVGKDAHYQALTSDPQPKIDTERFAPYIVHPLPEIDWSVQIPKRGDQRQMDVWQRLGVYAAGLALEDAGLKDNLEATSTMDMIVAAGGGERDISVDAQILANGRETAGQDTVERGDMLNKMLSTELRPTLFLAQLSNLAAGNISIVHKVTGSSRTFMGEEGAGVSAIETAVKRIAAGQSSHILVGASYNSEHFDMLLGHELGGYLKSDGWAPVWERQGSEGGGLITGSAGVFLVLEREDYAKQRDAHIYAAIDALETNQINRNRQNLASAIEHMFEKTGIAKSSFGISAASGVHGATQAEQSVLDSLDLRYRGMSTVLGHMREAQFPFAMALAALAVEREQALAPFSAQEKPHQDKIADAFITTIGLGRAEGVARLVKYEG